MYRNLLFSIIVSMVALVACSSLPETGFSTLPEGDAVRGETLYNENINGAPSCATCHLLSEETLVGGGFAGYAEIAGSRVEGQSAEEYTYNAIMRPASHLVDGYSNLMYTEYSTKLAEQDVADLIAFLLTQ